jgi:hypothetical protein
MVFSRRVFAFQRLSRLRKTPFEPFKYKNDHFAETGSGQT